MSGRRIWSCGVLACAAALPISLAACDSADSKAARRKTSTSTATEATSTSVPTDATSAKPDLIVAGIEPVGTLQAGQCVKFAVTIKNNGPGASPDVKHGILLYVDGDRSTMPWSDNYSQALAPGQSRTQTTNGGHGDSACDASGNMWRAVAGAHTIQAWVDDHEGKSGNGLIDEVTGQNNRLSVSITVPA